MKKLVRKMHSGVVPMYFNLDFVLKLNKRDWDGLQEVFNKLEAYEATNHTPEECAAAFEERDNYKMLRADADRIREGMMQKELMLISDKMRLEKELAAYRAAEQDGTLLRLPCKVGDKVFYLDWNVVTEKYSIICGTILNIRYDYNDRLVFVSDGKYLLLLGKYGFLTLEAAEAALKEQEANDGKQ